MLKDESGFLEIESLDALLKGHTGPVVKPTDLKLVLS